MPTWLPAPFPQSPESDGYHEFPGRPVLEAEVNGPPISRLQYTATVKRYSAPFMLTESQLDEFEDFYENTLAFGAIPYDWRERGNLSKPIRKFRIVGDPAYQHMGGPNWLVTLSLIRLP